MAEFMGDRASGYSVQSLVCLARGPTPKVPPALVAIERFISWV
jgi:hypothetical protein